MILTKNEFLKKFGYKSRNSLSRLVTTGKIVLNSNGDIDFSNTTNKKWKSDFAAKNKSKTEKKPKKTKTAKPAKEPKEQTEQTITPETVEQLKLLAHRSKLDESAAKAELLQLKLARERKEVVDAAILIKVLDLTFSDLFANLLAFPKRYAVETINLIAAHPEEAQAVLTDFLTQKITATLDAALKNSRIATKKYLKTNDNA